MNDEGVKLELNSITVSFKELLDIGNAKKAWLKEKGLANNDETTAQFLKMVILGYVNSQNSRN